jgi:hypothetical protein
MQDPWRQRWLGGFERMASIDPSTDWGTGFLPFFSKQGRELLQRSFGFFAKETICRHHERGKVPTLLEARPKTFLLFRTFMGC